MNLKSLAALCLVGLFVMVEVIECVQIEPSMPNARCKCRKVTSSRIKREMIKKIEIFPAKSHCPTIEIILTMKDDIQICIDPKTKWFLSLLSKLKNQQNQKKQANGENTMETSNANINDENNRTTTV
ncbi:C-X-C motif chemokine 11-1-like [Pyxicephalus adspersus]|uniref:C-X-C motif chemokine 11-1-like n=1 Tax=Pyxicephalus adspersus TaxID=30357 RepID=UPI003B593806